MIRQNLVRRRRHGCMKTKQTSDKQGTGNSTTSQGQSDARAQTIPTDIRKTGRYDVSIFAHRVYLFLQSSSIETGKKAPEQVSNIGRRGSRPQGLSDALLLKGSTIFVSEHRSGTQHNIPKAGKQFSLLVGVYLLVSLLVNLDSTEVIPHP